jgi:DNA mismatch repair ATPase MutS
VDDLATGQSTFMVEMNETTNILNHATAKSLVLLDEIGRGTATFDGLSIAWAVGEYLAMEIKSRTIFATHYHELNELAGILPNVANYQVTVKEMPDKLIFLHQVQPGGAQKSYGIEAGRLAGLPAVVIQRAKQVMGQIEQHSKIACHGVTEYGVRKLGFSSHHDNFSETRLLFSRRNKICYYCRLAISLLLYKYPATCEVLSSTWDTPKHNPLWTCNGHSKSGAFKFLN